MSQTMRPNLQPPITYLITNGETTPATIPSSSEFQRLLKLIEAAVAARISLIQIREKQLTARVLYELALSAAAITLASETLLLINDRVDIAAAAGADGVHLTTRSLAAAAIRSAFGASVLLGVSTHSIAEGQRARDQGADFVVFGPVFETASKRTYGPPLGLETLAKITSELAPFPVLALGGVTADNARECIAAGASGIAGITLFSQSSDLQSIVKLVGNEGRD